MDLILRAKELLHIEKNVAVGPWEEMQYDASYYVVMKDCDDSCICTIETGIAGQDEAEFIAICRLLAPEMAKRLIELESWTPVSERLPQTKQRVMVRFLRDGKKIMTMADYIAPRSVLSEDYLNDDCPLDFSDYDDKTDTYWTPGGFYEFQEMADTYWFIDEPVIEWLPLPN